MTPAATPGETPASRPRLLVVDDQPINVQALYRALCADHQVLVATSGEQALAMCAERQPDLVLLDVVMPGIDGFEVCRRLQSDASTQHIPVIFVTASSDEAAERHGLDVGAVDFITKPINPAIVRARVKTHLTLKAQSDLLRQLAFVDGLTGVFNRRHFDERLLDEWQRSGRNGAPLSLLLLDIDFFKRFNDLYGHQSGDDCLRCTAQALKGSLNRPADVMARYGGEEFACILPNTDAAGALVVGRRLEQCVRALRIAHGSSTAGPFVSASVGVATRGQDKDESIAALLARADRQLYRAKAQGRSQACADIDDATSAEHQPGAPALESRP
jgi:diguanylate cyclase (GGDEF)-like protein